MLYDKLIKLNVIFVIKRFTDRNAVSEIECKDTHFFHNDKKNEYLFYFFTLYLYWRRVPISSLFSLRVPMVIRKQL